MSLEYTDDPHPRNSYWEMWGHPMFDNPDAAAVVYELNECRKLTATATSASSPSTRPGLGVGPPRPSWPTGRRRNRASVCPPGDRGPNVRYTIQSYASDRPEGHRYA